MLFYGNIRGLAYFTKKIHIFFGSHFYLFNKSVVSVLFQYSERMPIHYHNYVETWVSYIKLIKDYDIVPEMT